MASLLVWLCPRSSGCAHFGSARLCFTGGYLPTPWRWDQAAFDQTWCKYLVAALLSVHHIDGIGLLPLGESLWQNLGAAQQHMRGGLSRLLCCACDERQHVCTAKTALRFPITWIWKSRK